MKPSVYLETTIISHLTARKSRDASLAGLQQITRDWWEAGRHEYDLFVSEAVVDEAREGDPAAAQTRLHLIQGTPRLSATTEAVELAKQIVREADLPARAGVDALHVAIAAVHNVNILLTWNCKHIASLRFRPRIQSTCLRMGRTPPVLTTPLELLES